ncbi:SMP-30/gluconolactonase/LRE family protein [Aureitalea sp. L0-47]|uniref:SMP-30/gluconolactonase/LRE family protein n=1 Tax=Aureitalea sp. L0-47 TaxID=2816962 RepID=UPI0022386C6B|nr:SMP-30/gluconolactonase/LRE family protein [Aureitalea sp. L0-47]MCW5519396.1 SMP-30/gluconolactonase/LRE family protein [Aureitalea sp. L0-47]
MKYFSLFFVAILLFSCADSSKKGESEIASEDKTERSEVVLERKFRALLGEGAIWNHEKQELYWVDILGKSVNIYNPSNKSNREFPLPFRVGTVVPQTDSTAVVALDNGIYILNTLNRLLTPLSDVEADVPTNRFNDGKCDPNGNLWIGSMHLEQTEPAANLYKVAPDGTTTKMLDNITISNGIVWSKDGKTMYYIDSPTSEIRAYDFDLETSTISNERVVVEVDEEDGTLDGMAIDEEDKLWVGLWNGNAVARFNPENGKLMEKIEVPAHNVTACAFGGENLDILYITTARIDMTEEELEKYPLAGSIFSVKPGVKGVKSAFFGTPE